MRCIALLDGLTAVEGCAGLPRVRGALVAASPAAAVFSGRRNSMNRFILATTAALALAACSDTNPVIGTRTPPSSPNPYRPVYGAGQTIFTDSMAPNRTSVDTDGGREVGTRFTVDTDGLVNRFRFWKAAGESGTHTARLWTTSGTLLASATFSNETSSGWQEVSGGTAIAAGTYVVSVNTNVQMVKTAMYFDTAGAISHDDIYANLSYHGQPAGSFPTTGASGIYFVDVNFRPFICDLDVPNSCV